MPGSAENETAQTEGSVAAVSVKLPPYWPNDPYIWFAQVEAQFATRGITNDKTKYSYVVSSLSPDVAQEVRELLITPPAEEPYKTLKDELIKRTSASEQKRLHQLLTSEELGDRKPSQLLRRMKQLLGEKNLEDSILKQLFVQRLPTNIQLILASTSQTTTLEELAALADKIMEVSVPFSISAVQKPENKVLSAPSNEIKELREQIKELTSQVASLKSYMRERSKSRGRSQTRKANRSPSSDAKSSTSGDMCWYHRTYGAEANNCRKPCNYKPKSEPAGNAQASE